MTSVNEARSADNATRPANDLDQRNVDRPLVRTATGTAQVRSSPDAAGLERNRIIALGLDTAIPAATRPNFVSSENIARVEHLLISDAHYIQHGAIRQLPELIQRGQQSQLAVNNRRPGPSTRQDQLSTMAGTGSSDPSRVGRNLRPFPGLRDALQDSTDIATAMAALESRTRLQEEERADDASYDSSVDDPNTFPALPSITRRQSEQLERNTGGSLLGNWSLPDLRKIKSAFTHISFLEGITDPDVILSILEKHPEIDSLYLSPILLPTDPRYSPYEMHLVSPGTVDILNCCVVSRKNVIRYIRGKEPRCLSLKRWSFEQKVMLKLRKISFFKNFKLIKAFSALGHHLDMSAFGKTKRRLRSQLLTCNPNYAETLLLVRTMCLDMAELSMIHVDAELTYILGEFMEDQEQYSLDVTAKLERYLSILQHLISRMCWDDVIAAGLAEESKGRREGAPKRVNELRKMQRLRHGTSGAGARQIVDDVNIGTWITSSDSLESDDLHRKRWEKCTKLSRFIYLIDCLIVNTLHEVFAKSLQTSVNYLSLHLETFPSDEEIRAIVKGYLGDVDQSDIFLNSDTDGDSGGGPGPQGPKEDPNMWDQSDKRNNNEKTDNQAGINTPSTAQGQGKQEATGASRSHLNTEIEASSTWTTLRMSSSADRFGTDTAGFGTPSTMDNAVYSAAIGETDLSDSLNTTSSTISDEQVNINPLGASDFGNIQGALMDDLNAPAIVGAEMRIFRLYDGQHQNEHANFGRRIGAVPDQELDADDITVIERLSNSQQTQGSLTSIGRPSDRSSTHIFNIEQSDTEDTEDDLTITSDEKSSSSNRRKDKQSNNFAFSTSNIPPNNNLGKSGNHWQDGKLMLPTNRHPFTGIVATASILRSGTKKDLVSSLGRNKLNEALTTLQEKIENVESDSSDSIYSLPNDNSRPIKGTESFHHSFYPPIVNTVGNTADQILDNENEACSQTNNKSPSSNDTMIEEEINVYIKRSNSASSRTFSRRRGDSGKDMQKYRDYYASCSQSNEASDSEALPCTNGITYNKNNVQVVSPATENSSKECGISGMFSGIFNQNLESSVDFLSEADEELGSSLGAPVRDRAAWVSDYFGNYINVRSSRSSSVDEYGLANAGASSTLTESLNILDEPEGATAVVIRAQENEQRLRRELNASDDDTTESFTSACNFDEYSASERGEKQISDMERNRCQHKCTDEVQPDAKKTTGDNISQEMRNETERNDHELNPATEFQPNNQQVPVINITYENEESEFTESDSIYMRINTTPNVEDEDRLTVSDFFLNEENDNNFDNVNTRLSDFKDEDRGVTAIKFNEESTPGVRKDGGKRRKIGKSDQDAVLIQASASNTNDLSAPKSEQTEKETYSIDKGRSSGSSGSSERKTNTVNSQSSPSVLSEEASYAKNLQELVNVLPQSISTLFKVQRSALPKYDQEYTVSAHGHNVHFTSKDSSFVKTESERSSQLSLDEADSVHQLHVNTPIVEEDSTEEVVKITEASKITDNDTENDITDGDLESGNDDIHEFIAFGQVPDNRVKLANTGENFAMDAKGNTNVKNSWNKDIKRSEDKNIENPVGNRRDQNYSGGGSGGGGSGGGGGGGGSGYTPSIKKRLIPDLKPMFHACLSIDKELVCMTPDVYDFTASSFNVVHDMEMRLRNSENLTSNPVFLTFTQPSADGQTSVDKKPKGPNLDRVLRFDKTVTSLKNNIYGCIEQMFHSVAVYTKEMQKLYLKYFLDKHIDYDKDTKDVDFYCRYLQRYDSQIKIADRLPESQRLGMFLIDLTPYKEFVRQCSLGGLQQLQLELNADVVRRTRKLIEQLGELHEILESKSTTLVPLFRRLTTMDCVNELLLNIENKDVSHIGALYNVIDRFDVPHTEVDRRAFESTHYLITSARHAGYISRQERHEVIDAIDKCLIRDVRYIHVQVKKLVRPLVESDVFLDGHSDPLEVRKLLIDTEEVVRTYVAMANFVREVQRYLGRPDTNFTELFHLSSRYVNTRNLWLLMADWDYKLDKWKNQNFQTLDMQEINSYTFRYMDACDKLEKLLPKNSVISVFEEKIDIMLRWLNFIIEFRGQAVKPRHWSQIEEVLGVEFGEQFPLTLASLMSINAIEKLRNLHVILNKARAESNVQNEYTEVTRQCRSLTLPVQVRQKVLIDGEDQITVHLLGDTFEIEESLNYFVMELERIELSPHSGFLHASLEEFVQSIFEALEKLVLWMEMQMKLNRLRRLIIRHPEVSDTVPADVARYKQIYLAYSQFVESVLSDPNVMKWCASQELHDIIESQHEEIIRLYRNIKRDIEVRGGQENNQQDAQQQFGTWVVM